MLEEIGKLKCPIFEYHFLFCLLKIEIQFRLFFGNIGGYSAHKNLNSEIEVSSID